jgi:hypothetical protein
MLPSFVERRLALVVFHDQFVAGWDMTVPRRKVGRSQPQPLPNAVSTNRGATGEFRPCRLSPNECLVFSKRPIDDQNARSK